MIANAPILADLIAAAISGCLSFFLSSFTARVVYSGYKLESTSSDHNWFMSGFMPMFIGGLIGFCVPMLILQILNLSPYPPSVFNPITIWWIVGALAAMFGACLSTSQCIRATAKEKSNKAKSTK